MNKAKITTVDIDGVVWEKEGDFIVGAIGNRQGQEPPNIEVDFSKTTEFEIVYVLATMLVVVGQIDMKLATAAIKLFEDKMR